MSDQFHVIAYSCKLFILICHLENWCLGELCRSENDHQSLSNISIFISVSDICLALTS